MPNNIFIGNDPTLSQRDFSAPIDEDFDGMERSLNERMAKLRQMKAQINEQKQAKVPTVWDEICRVMQEAGDKELEIITTDEDWVASNNAILALVQEATMQLVIPIIERSQNGRDVLEKHLSLTKRLKRDAGRVMDAELNDFKEYKERYSDMTYADYQKMKNLKKPKK